MKFFICILLMFSCVSSRPNEKRTCGYESCNPTVDGVINVHLVPHSHDDVGWLKTVDQYYYGSKTSTQRAAVQYILDSVVDELLKHPSRRFIYVETAFFQRWWLEQSQERQEDVKKLVEEGRLEFAGGAWSMNDEAAVHYQSVLDQLTWGLRVLDDIFGKCARPRVGWQIDPFGHSKELASIWALSGFDGIFTARIDYIDKYRRMLDKELEMIWQGSDDIGKASDIFFGVLYNHYSAPPGFCYDILCNDDPFIDDETSPDYNVDKLVRGFADYIKNLAGAYKTKHVLVTMGDDFMYQDARVWYKNMDKLIKYVNKNVTTLNVLYSTPSCYLKSLHESRSIWPTKQDDFFPYGSDSNSYWTGYYTSRPAGKYFERRGNNVLQTCKQLYALTNMDHTNINDLNSLKSAMGIFQHHDAITGTEKQHVSNDYNRILELGINKCFKIIKKSLNQLMKTNEKIIDLQTCHLNETQCSVTEKSKKFMITLYNPLSHEVDHYVRLPVMSDNHYDVIDGTGLHLRSETIPLNDEAIFKQLPRINAEQELVFRALSIPPLGYKSFYVEETSVNKGRILIHNTKYSIENEFMSVNLNPNTNKLESITFKKKDEPMNIPLQQDILYYQGFAMSSRESPMNAERASGAYVFRPNGTTAYVINEEPEIKFYKGDRVQEIHQKFSDWATQVIRLYHGEKHIEFEWLIGPLPVEDQIGKEVITRFKSDFKNKGVFYTDSNGRQMMKRVRNHRPTWDLDLKEPISGNYYPVTSMISIKDEASGLEMFVLTDRAQGGSSIQDGEIELMMHRRLLKDDGFGVGEALNEMVDGVGLVVKGSHYLYIGDSEGNDFPLAAHSRVLALKRLLQPEIFLSEIGNISFDEWSKQNNEFSGITSVPKNVHVLTLEPWKDGSVLLRLENYFQKSDYGKENGTAVIDLENLLVGVKIISVREMLLAANQGKNEGERLQWSTIENSKYEAIYDNFENTPISKFVITLLPMEIKTFIVTVQYL